MKFFFRIIDRNKAKRTDSPVNNLPQFIPRNFRRTKGNGERARREPPEKKSYRKSAGKIPGSSSKHPSQHEIRKEKVCDKNLKKVEERVSESAKSDTSERTESKSEKVGEDVTRPSKVKIKCEKSDNKKSPEGKDKIEALKTLVSKTDKENKVVSKGLLNEGDEVPKEKEYDNNNHKVTKVEKTDESFSTSTKDTVKQDQPLIKKEPISPEAEKTADKLILKVSKEFLDNANFVTPKPQLFSKPVTKSYTSITLNRSENVEIITKIEPVSNKDGKAIGHHIIKQTIKKGSKLKTNSPKKVSSKSGQVTIPRLVITKKGLKKKVSPKQEFKSLSNGVEAANKIIKNDPEVFKNTPIKSEADSEDEKSKFFRYMNLAPITSVRPAEETPTPVKKELPETPVIKPIQLPKKQIIISRPTGGQKRKNSSPIKNEKVKISKMDLKKSVKIILQQKPSSSQAAATTKGLKHDTGLQSLINSCKIPSSLSITIKESSEKNSLPLVVPPVKNFIEILKLPEESSDKDKAQIPETKPKEPTKLDLSKFCDNDSEQKVDQDLSEIAKSLTEKIPMSTTISQIVGPKQQFQIPVKTNIPSKIQIQPAPVPEVNKALSKENLVKLTPRSPQTFQKIFEESLKKPPDGPKTSAVEVPPSDPNTPSSSKRNILEIASQLFKKTKLEQDKKGTVTLPKVPIPRLPNSRTQQILGSQQVAKLVPQTVASLHSTSLGMNYTVSVGQQSPSKVMKSNGILSPVKADSVPGVPECKPSVSPFNELKSIKTDFKVPSPSIGSPKLPEVSSASCSSPKPKTPSPKHSPKSSPLVKHMYAPTVPMFNQKVASPMNRFACLSPKPQSSPKSSSTSPRLLSPPTSVPTSKPASPTQSSSVQNATSPVLSPNEILEKYNIQNLAQLTASFNLNPPSVIANNQLAAFQHAMLLKHFEMQNRQNWLNRNQGPLLQYEKYLQSLNGGLNGSQNHT